MAAVINLSIDKGTSFEATFNLTNFDDSVASLAGYTATARIKKHPTATSYKSFSTTVTAATGKIKISMGSTITSQLDSGRNYYDVVIANNSGSSITKVFEGTVIVKDTVSA